MNQVTVILETGEKKQINVYDIVHDNYFNCEYIFFKYSDSEELKVSLYEKKANYISFKNIDNPLMQMAVNTIIQSRKEDFGYGK